MALMNTDMTGVRAWDETHPAGSFHWRITVQHKPDENKVLLILTNQTEPLVGQKVFDNIDTTNMMALGKLKTYYKKAGLEIKREMDPCALEGVELYACVKHTQQGVNTYANVDPATIRGLQEGPAHPEGVF